MKICEHMKLHISQITKEIIDQCNLNNIVFHYGWLYIDIWKGIPDLKQAGRIENDISKSHLSNFGYYSTRITPGLWKHKYQPIAFSLVVDNFCVKYFGEKHNNHLLASLR